MMDPSVCRRCDGPMFLDRDVGGPFVTQALACWRGCTRIELDAKGQPLPVVQPSRLGRDVDQHVYI